MSRRTRTFLVLSLGFVVFGMALTAVGVAWPSIAASLGRPLADLGVVTLVFGGGYTVSTLVSGRVAAASGLGRLLVAAGVAVVTALAVLSAAPNWPTLLIGAGLLGTSGGFNDAATNTYVAIRRGPRAMGVIHGAFGVGAIAGPLFATMLLAAGVSWRAAFGALAAAQGVYVAGLWLAARRLDVREAAAQDPSPASLRSPTFGWSLVVFFLYSGIAVGAGVWAFTYLTEARGLSDGAAGLTVAAYWGGFTASRFVLGAVGHRLPAPDAVRWSVAATALGLGVFWWNPSTGLSAAALVFTGFAHGPVFPVQVILTRRRFGAAQTGSAVGYQFAAGNIGGATLPGLTGLLVGGRGLEVIPPLLVANAALLWVAVEMLHRAAGTVPDPPVGTVAAGRDAAGSR